MATRSGRPITVRWLLVDQAHARKEDLRGALRTLHSSELPRAELSVNLKADGTLALIKVVGDLSTVSDTLKEAVVRTFTEADHHEALALVKAEDWEPAEVDDDVVAGLLEPAGKTR